MIGLDTNVIVRYIAQDDEVQSAEAARIFEKEISRTNKGFISSIALCETLWVLGRGYKQPKAKLLEVVSMLLEIDNIELEHRDCVWSAYCDWEEGRADFSDYFLARIGKQVGCEWTYTFDQNAQLHRFFRQPE